MCVCVLLLQIICIFGRVILYRKILSRSRSFFNIFISLAATLFRFIAYFVSVILFCLFSFSFVVMRNTQLSSICECVDGCV